mgnify:CR=1 FL=1
MGKETKRLVTTGGHYAFLKIAEGCDKRCTYCIIPYLRGRYRSVPMEQLERGQGAADQGVRTDPWWPRRRPFTERICMGRRSFQSF